jgi:hypothetical protein
MKRQEFVDQAKTLMVHMQNSVDILEGTKASLGTLIDQVDSLEPDEPVVAEAPVLLSPLPADYVRPTLEEFVANGYQAEHYQAFFVRYENGLRVAEAAKAGVKDLTDELELVAAVAEQPWSYVRDANGIITGTTGTVPVTPVEAPPAADPLPEASEAPAVSAT